MPTQLVSTLFWFCSNIYHLNCIRYPGNYTDVDTYRMHCPEAALPTVLFSGMVEGSGGQLNDGLTLLHYDLRTTVYDASTRAQSTFLISVYLKNGKRWAKFPQLAVQSQIFVSGQIFGITRQTPRLAVLADDIYFFLITGPLQSIPPSPKSSTRK